MTTDNPTPTDTDPVDVSHTQPRLPNLELPEYHGRSPIGMLSSISGTGNRIMTPHSLGQVSVLVLEVKMTEEGHRETDDGLKYVEKHKVVDMFDVAGDQGSRLISTLRSLHRTASDQTEGRTPIDGLGDIGYTDASGVMLTPKEVAALRGDPIRAMLSDELTPVVVKYDSNTRLVWPDEYGKDEPRPKIGDAHPDDHEEGVDADRVTALLHHATGEPLPTEDIPEDNEPDNAEPDTVETPDTVDPEPDTDPDMSTADLDDWEDGYDSADLSDGVEPYDNVVPISGGPDPFPETDDGLEGDDVDEMAPTQADFRMVDRNVSELVPIVNEIGDRVLLGRLLNAEKQGRGRGLKPRQGAIAAITNAIIHADSEGGE